MTGTLLPGFLDALLELPGQEARPESGRHRLMLLRAVVVTEAVVGEAKCFRDHPAFAIVLVQKGIKTEALEVLEGDLRKDGIAEFGIFVLVDAPEALRVQLGRKRL